MIIFSASKQINNLVAVLETQLISFSMCRGEAINFEKSNVIFSLNTRERVKNDLKQILRMPCTESLSKYLGCNVEVDGRY